MRVSQVYTGLYLKAEDLQGRANRVVIDAAGLESMPDGVQKIVLSLKNSQKKLVCNITNARILASAFTDETDAWIGRAVELYPEKVSMQGRVVDCIRVRIPIPPAVVKPRPQPQPVAPSEADYDALGTGFEDMENDVPM